MACKTNETIIPTLSLLIMMWYGARAQSTCANALMSLTPCLNYVTGSSSGPSSLCCSQLNWVIGNQPDCLCQLINGGAAAIGMAANPSIALALPGACSIQTPAVSQCNGANGPTASASTPANAPISSQTSDSTPTDNSPNDINPTSTTPATPSQTSTPSSSGGGSKTVPSTKNASSSSTITKSPFSIGVFLLLAVSFYF